VSNQYTVATEEAGSGPTRGLDEQGQPADPGQWARDDVPRARRPKRDEVRWPRARVRGQGARRQAGARSPNPDTRAGLSPQPAAPRTLPAAPDRGPRPPHAAASIPWPHPAAHLGRSRPPLSPPRPQPHLRRLTYRGPIPAAGRGPAASFASPVTGVRATRPVGGLDAARPRDVAEDSHPARQLPQPSPATPAARPRPRDRRSDRPGAAVNRALAARDQAEITFGRGRLGVRLHRAVSRNSRKSMSRAWAPSLPRQLQRGTARPVVRATQ
jgi:hypothetical protein